MANGPHRTVIVAVALSGATLRDTLRVLDDQADSVRTLIGSHEPVTSTEPALWGLQSTGPEPVSDSRGLARDAHTSLRVAAKIDIRHFKVWADRRDLRFTIRRLGTGITDLLGPPFFANGSWVVKWTTLETATALLAGVHILVWTFSRPIATRYRSVTVAGDDSFGACEISEAIPMTIRVLPVAISNVIFDFFFAILIRSPKPFLRASRGTQCDEANEAFRNFVHALVLLFDCGPLVQTELHVPDLVPSPGNNWRRTFPPKCARDY